MELAINDIDLEVDHFNIVEIVRNDIVHNPDGTNYWINQELATPEKFEDFHKLLQAVLAEFPNYPTQITIINEQVLLAMEEATTTWARQLDLERAELIRQSGRTWLLNL